MAVCSSGQRVSIWADCEVYLEGSRMREYLITLRGLEFGEKKMQSILGITAREARSATWDFWVPSQHLQ